MLIPLVAVYRPQFSALGSGSAEGAMPVTTGIIQSREQCAAISSQTDAGVAVILTTAIVVLLTIIVKTPRPTRPPRSSRP